MKSSSVWQVVGISLKQHNQEGEGEREGENQKLCFHSSYDPVRLVAEHDSDVEIEVIEATSSIHRANLMFGCWVAVLRLTNPGNWCSFSAAFHSLAWCIACLKEPKAGDWGSHTQAMPWSMHSMSPPLWTSPHEAFKSLIDAWTAQHCPNRQSDAAECMQTLLRWGPGLLRADLSWEKKLLVEDRITILDTGGPHTPLLLQFQANQPFQQTLQSLLQAWHTDDGLVRGLTQSPDLILVHIDRWASTAHGVDYAPNILLWEEETAFPFGVRTGFWQPFRISE